MESDFLVFGASKMNAQNIVAGVRCVGFLVRYHVGSLFFSAPMYEIEDNGDVDLGFGFGVQTLPHIRNVEEVCENILNASGVKLHVSGEDLEKVTDIGKRLLLKNPDLSFNEMLEKCLTSTTFPIEGGVISLVYNTPGSFTVHIKEDA